MLLQHLLLYLIFQAISTVYGRLEIKNSSSLPSSSTVGADLKATSSSTSVVGLSTTDVLGLNVSLLTVSHHENLTADDNAGYPHARNDGYDVRIMGADTYELELRNGKLDFDLCQASACNGRILACYESDTSTYSMIEDPRHLCAEITGSLCGFQVDISPQGVYLMESAGILFKGFFIAQRCQIAMNSTSFIVDRRTYDSCIPKISNKSLKLVVQAASPSCPLIVKNAKLKPKGASSTSTHANNSTTEASSSATTIWIVVSCLIFAFALLGLVVFAIWFFKLRHRKAKPAKTQPAPTEVGASTAKVQTQVKMKDEIKNDDAGVKKDVAPVKSELKIAVATPTKPEEPAKVKAVEVVTTELKTTEDADGDSTVPPTVPTAPPAVGPAVPNENTQARSKAVMETFSLRSMRSTMPDKGKPDAALLLLQTHNEYRRLAPIHSLNKVYKVYPRTAKHNAELYPPGKKYSDEMVEALLLAPVDRALKGFHRLSADARKILVDHGVEFDYNDNTTKVSRFARRMVREDDTEEHVKAYLFLAEYGKDFDPTPDILSKLSAPLLFVVAMGTRYSDQLREAAIIEMRRHLPIIRRCWSLEERQKCHFPINGIEQACEMDKRLLRKNADLKSHSTSSGRKAAFKRQKRR